MDKQILDVCCGSRMFWFDNQYAEAEVRDFTHFTSCGFCVVVTSKHFDKQNIPFSEFGKTVFLTQAEVEQKFKEMDGEQK